jgi:hypothetical protein
MVMSRKQLAFYVLEVAGFVGAAAALLPVPWWAWLAIGMVGWFARISRRAV